MNQHVSTTQIVGAEDLWFGEISPETMEVINRMEIERYLVLVKQVQLKKKTAGGILLPDQMKSDQEWTHGLVQVVKLGPGAYRGRKFEDMGIHYTDAPQPGQLCIINAKVPERIKIDGCLFFTIPDDGIKARVSRQDVQRVSFTIE